jgi:surfactin synthase thioesterase subunit
MSHAAQEKQAWETSRVRLFCFPFAGDGASIFRHWPQLLPSEISVHPIKLPGREVRIREAAFRDVQPAADDLGRDPGSSVFVAVIRLLPS